jgi:hypothetical protein
MRARKIPRRIRALGGGAALIALAGVLAACDYGPDNVAKKITIVGSDTTQDVMTRIAFKYTVGLGIPADYNPANSSHDDLQSRRPVQRPVGPESRAGCPCGRRLRRADVVHASGRRHPHGAQRINGWPQRPA